MIFPNSSCVTSGLAVDNPILTNTNGLKALTQSGREKKRIEAVYNYVSSNGGYLFTKVRMQGKKMIYGTLANERFTYGLGGRTRKELCAVYAPDGVQAINKAVSEGRPLFIPEGEKDADTLAKQGYTAFPYGGVNDWSADMAQLCKGAVVYVLADNDGPGRRVASTIQGDLQGIAESAKVIVPVPDIPKADISDYFAAGHSKAEFERLFVRQGKSFDTLAVRWELGEIEKPPFCRTDFYSCRRRFFANLDKELKERGA